MIFFSYSAIFAVCGRAVGICVILAQYVDPEEVHPLSSDKQNDTRKKKCIKHKNTVGNLTSIM